MSARRSLLDRHWGWPTIGRQAPLIATFALIAAIAALMSYRSSLRWERDVWL